MVLNIIPSQWYQHFQIVKFGLFKDRIFATVYGEITILKPGAISMKKFWTSLI